MTFDEMISRSIKIKKLYASKNAADGHKNWTAGDYLAGMMKDMGDLSKLIMVKENLRSMDGDIDAKLAHEIGDCFWSLVVIADELSIDPKVAFASMLREVEERFA